MAITEDIIRPPIRVHVESNPIEESSSHALHSAIITLTLGILGSSVLPVPWAFSRTGILPGLGIALIVALANAYTGTLLIRAAGHLKKNTYEGVVAAAFRSTTFRTIAQLALVSLLFGTLAGDAALLADSGALTIHALTDGQAPEWLTGNGRVPMLILILGLVLPLSLSRRMRSLERAATAGVGLVTVLAAIIVVQSLIKAGLPAIKSKELPVVKIASVEELPEAISILFFGFYLQPMLLPLLSELPQGKRGEDVLCNALQLVTVVISYILYAIVGIFGAARWGMSTEGDILMNKWLGSDKAGGMLDLAMAIYLSISMAPMVITMRYLLDAVVAKGELTAFSWKRDVGFTIGGILSATAVAIAMPQRAEKLFAITGATGVCLVSYIIPVAVHLKLYLTRKRPSVASEQEAWLLEDAAMLEGGAAAAAAVERRHSSVIEGIDLNTPLLAPEDHLRSAEQAERALYSPTIAIISERPSRARRYPHLRELKELPWWKRPVILCYHVVLPVAVLVLGVGTSVWALVLAVKKL